MMQPEPTKESICNAVFVLYNANSSQQEITSAGNYLQKIKESENGLKISIHLFQNTMDANVLFNCLVIIKYAIDERCVYFHKKCPFWSMIDKPVIDT